MRTTPRVAKWLLTQFGCAARNEVILGDLNEQFQTGRSRGWYWRQVLTSVVVGLWQEVSQHPGLALRALLIGWTGLLLSAVVFRWLVSYIRANVHPGSERSYELFVRVLPLSWWKYHMDISMALFMLIGAFISCIAGAAIGWVVARLHRPHHKPLVLLFVASVYVALIPMFYLFALRTADFRAVWLALGLVGNLMSVGSAWIGARFVGNSK